MSNSSARDSAVNCGRGRTAIWLPKRRDSCKSRCKLVVSRKMMFQTVGHRPRTDQRVRIGATPEGKLLALQHDIVHHAAMLDDYKEDCGEATPMQYSVPNLRVTYATARRNVGSPTSMRGPGARARSLCHRIGAQ